MNRLRYYLDILASPVVAVLLIVLFGFAPLAFVAGVFAWSFSEYAVHRWFLHSTQGRALHRAHHAKPDDVIIDTAWQVYLAFVAAYVLLGSSFTAGVLSSYAWYLYVHHCVHHFPRGIPNNLMVHHEGHHKFAKRNFGVGTVLWDHLLGTRHV